MYTTLAELKPYLLRVAAEQDIAQPLFYTLQQNNSDHIVYVCVGNTEPYQALQPFNLLWLNTDTGHADYNKLLVREARAPVDGYQNKWTEITADAQFWARPVWDTPKPSDQETLDHFRQIGNVHHLEAKMIDAIGPEGGTLTGALVPRTAATYATNEVVPLSFIQMLMQAVQQATANATNSVRSLNQQLISLRTRFNVVEPMVRKKVFHQEEDDVLWQIETDDSQLRHEVTVFNHEGKRMFPSSVDYVEGMLLIRFGAPRRGTAYYTPTTASLV